MFFDPSSIDIHTMHKVTSYSLAYDLNLWNQLRMLHYRRATKWEQHHVRDTRMLAFEDILSQKVDAYLAATLNLQ